MPYKGANDFGLEASIYNVLKVAGVINTIFKP
jgi:hypothetical protein